ncbi:hypothetical protein [Tumebacillus flagellatus]|uniref:Lipoprotein n=1 Tax=Tumebacillus flagellatus TaxID=1157490 RepID=A0A074LK26_9BACL|nr:hypothetical protein [Tumebacillus flagellatus]KEO80960.1 hypothetical protein EL26_23310 [Tumebacillus flagellatus]
MKKAAMAALLLTFLFAGCSSDKQDTAQQNTPNTTTPAKTTTPSTPSTPAAQDPAQTTPGVDPSVSEVRSAFGLTADYLDLPPTAIPSLGLGQMDKLAVDQKQGLALAKAVSSALTNIGWSQQDSPPGIFVTTDGNQFAIGMKKADGSFVLQRYELQADGTYKMTGQETKPAAK